MRLGKSGSLPGTVSSKQIGFYACSGKIVRVRPTTPRKGQTRHTVKCNACGREHPVSVMWRGLGRHEKYNHDISV